MNEVNASVHPREALESLNYVRWISENDLIFSLDFKWSCSFSIQPPFFLSHVMCNSYARFKRKKENPTCFQDLTIQMTYFPMNLYKFRYNFMILLGEYRSFSDLENKCLVKGGADK